MQYRADLVLLQNETPHTVEGEKTELHISSDPQLKIYVPQDKDDHEDFCFSEKLAPRLTEWLATDYSSNRTEQYDEHAIRVIQSIVRSQNRQRNLFRDSKSRRDS